MTVNQHRLLVCNTSETLFKISKFIYKNQDIRKINKCWRGWGRNLIVDPLGVSCSAAASLGEKKGICCQFTVCWEWGCETHRVWCTHTRAHTPTQSSPGDWRGEDNHRLVQCQTGAPSPTEANMPTCPNVKCQFASVCYSEPFVRLRRMNDETTDYLKNRLTARLMGRKLEVNEWPSSVLQASSFNSLWSNHFS